MDLTQCALIVNQVLIVFFFSSKMKVVLCLFAVLAVVAAFPQREGQLFSNEAIKQAQSSYLIPKDAQIQKVS